MPLRIEVLFYGTMDRLLRLLTGQDQGVPLDRAALELATIEFPELDIDAFLTVLDSYARELEPRVSGAPGADYVHVTNEYLFEELGFAGNTSDYYNPRNSCLNEVLAARTGIPITLSLVYMEIGRRLERPIYGIGLPGHFIVRYYDGLYSAFIDPFHGGRLLDAEECFSVARQASGLELEPDPRLLASAGKAQILTRMIANLRRAYLAQNLPAKAIAVTDLMIRVDPHAADEYRYRAGLHLQNQNMTASKEDLTRYLELAPDAPDRAEVEEQLRTIQHWMASLN